MKYCEKCGKELLDSDAFCDRCGTKSSVPTRNSGRQIDTIKSNFPDRSQAVTNNETEIDDCLFTDEKSNKSNRFKLIIILSVSLVIVAAVTVLGIIFVPKMFDNDKSNEIQSTAASDAQITTAITEPATTQPTTAEPTTQVPTTKPQEDKQLLPDSSTVKLSQSDLTDLSKSELELARNEIYARRGRKFKTDYIQQYFDSQSWYKGTIEPEDFLENMLSEIEKYNVKLISDYEKSLGSSSDSNRVSFGDFSLELPNDWAYEKNGDTVDFYEKYCYDNEITDVSKGYLFSIEKTTKDVNGYMIGAENIGTNDGYNFLCFHPTGLGISQDKTANEKRSSALKQVNDVLKTFELE